MIITKLFHSAAKPNHLIVREALILCKMKYKKEEKGINMGPLRAMIVGIPNSWKINLINGISKTKSAKVGNRPGVTMTNQWIKLNPKVTYYTQSSYFRLKMKVLVLNSLLPEL